MPTSTAKEKVDVTVLDPQISHDIRVVDHSVIFRISTSLEGKIVMNGETKTSNGSNFFGAEFQNVPTGTQEYIITYTKDNQYAEVKGTVEIQ